MNIKNSINNISQTLPAGCKLIAVSKTNPPQKILEAYEAGHRRFGENKVQELVAKFEVLPRDIEWHLIGHLQSNKVKHIAPFVALIHSVDSLKLLQEVNKQGAKLNRVISCLLQMHIAQEETKFGFTKDEILDLLRSAEFKALENIHILGLMGMATMTQDSDQIRREFKGLKTSFEEIRESCVGPTIEMTELSMGMSADYRIAVEEGSTMVRVGSAIFGERNTSAI